MPEQDYVAIPNQPGGTGSPTGAQIAADDPSGIGVGPFVQQVSIANLSTAIRALVQQLAVLGVAQETNSGRLRVLVDNITGALTLTSLTNLTQISGFGPANTLTTAAHYMPLDIMADAWANNIRSRIT